MYKIQKTKSGIKVFSGDDHIKTVPSRYEEVLNQVTLLSNGKKRLENFERLHLEAELLRREMKSSLDPRIKYAAERIDGAVVDECIQINVRNAEKRHVLLFDNGERIKCSCALFKFGNKTTENSLY